MTGQNMLNNESRWWVAIDEKPAGPWLAAEIASAIKRGQVSSETLVCKPGDKSWVKLSETAELRQLVERIASATIEPQKNYYASSAEPQKKRIQSAGTMEGIIFKYCIYAIPAYLVASILITFFATVAVRAESGYGAVAFINGVRVIGKIAVLILFVIAGLKWKDKVGSAANYTCAAIITGFAFTFMSLVINIFVILLERSMIDPETDVSQQLTEYSFFYLTGLITEGIGTLFLLWEVFLLIWILLNRKNLSFSDDTVS